MFTRRLMTAVHEMLRKFSRHIQSVIYMSKLLPHFTLWLTGRLVSLSRKVGIGWDRKSSLCEILMLYASKLWRVQSWLIFSQDTNKCDCCISRLSNALIIVLFHKDLNDSVAVDCLGLCKGEKCKLGMKVGTVLSSRSSSNAAQLKCSATSLYVNYTFLC